MAYGFGGGTSQSQGYGQAAASMGAAGVSGVGGRSSKSQSGSSSKSSTGSRAAGGTADRSSVSGYSGSSASKSKSSSASRAAGGTADRSSVSGYSGSSASKSKSSTGTDTGRFGGSTTGTIGKGFGGDTASKYSGKTSTGYTPDLNRTRMASTWESMRDDTSTGYTPDLSKRSRISDRMKDVYGIDTKQSSYTPDLSKRTRMGSVGADAKAPSAYAKVPSATTTKAPSATAADYMTSRTTTTTPSTFSTSNAKQSTGFRAAADATAPATGFKSDIAARTEVNTVDQQTKAAIADSYRTAIKGRETEGEEDPYGTVHTGVKRANGSIDNALGAFGVMRSNLAAWTKEVFGKAVDEKTYLSSPAIQNALFDAKFGQAVAKYGSFEAAARSWYGGDKGVKNPNQRPKGGGPSTGEYAADAVGRQINAYNKATASIASNAKAAGTAVAAATRAAATAAPATAAAKTTATAVRNVRDDVNTYNRTKGLGVASEVPTPTARPAQTYDPVAGRITKNGQEFTISEFQRMSPAIQDVLSNYGKLNPNGTINLNSAYRDPASNKKAGGAKASEHLIANAFDFDISNMTDDQKAKAVADWRAAGAKRIGAYAGQKAIHVDMKDVSPDEGLDVKTMYNTHYKDAKKTTSTKDWLASVPSWFSDGLTRSVNRTSVASATAGYPNPPATTTAADTAAASTTTTDTPATAAAKAKATAAATGPATGPWGRKPEGPIAGQKYPMEPMTTAQKWGSFATKIGLSVFGGIPGMAATGLDVLSELATGRGVIDRAWASTDNPRGAGGTASTNAASTGQSGRTTGGGTRSSSERVQTPKSAATKTTSSTSSSSTFESKYLYDNGRPTPEQKWDWQSSKYIGVT
jgi:uncharacterized protein YcbK (DUF882 family)